MALDWIQLWFFVFLYFHSELATDEFGPLLQEETEARGVQGPPQGHSLKDHGVDREGGSLAAGTRTALSSLLVWLFPLAVNCNGSVLRARPALYLLLSAFLMSKSTVLLKRPVEACLE